MKSIKIDQHCHSNLSDWERSNSEILEIARKKWLDFIAVSDHDIFNEEFPVKARKYWFNSCEAVEISVNWHNSNEVHILTYSSLFSIEIKKKIKSILENTRQTRVWILENKIDSLNDRSIRVNLQEFYEFFSHKWIKPESITVRDLAKYVYLNKKNAAFIKDIFWDHICYDTFLREFLREDWDYWIIWWRIKCYFLPSIDDIRKNLDTSRTIISLAHPQDIFKNTHEMTENIAFYIDKWVNAIEIDSQTSKNWVHAIMHIKKEYNLVLTTWSNSHRDDTDEKHDEIWAQNPELNNSVINENYKQFLDLID